MTQECALQILQRGESVFLTGEPGAGKSYTVQRYLEWLVQSRIPSAITASTGIAAMQIGGMTIHAWSGIGIRHRITAKDLELIATNDRVRRRVTAAEVLVIDELSMMDARILDMVDAVCRFLRKAPHMPFGGLQVVLVGDFFQLPPVAKSDEPPAKFAFLANAWSSLNPRICYLTEQHRQSDARFLGVLNAIRRAELTDEVSEILSERIQDRDSDAFQTRLYTHNMDVDRVNHSKLQAIDGESHAFEMRAWGSEHMVQAMKRSCLSPERLELKVGARVMFTKNAIDGRFVNGTLGEVIAFDAEGLPVVKTSQGSQITPAVMEWVVADGDQVLAKLLQLPLRLAWAVTVHKSQGMTLDGATMDLSQAFEYGQGYVALSRVRSLAGLGLLGWNAKALQVHPEVLEKDGEFRAQSDKLLQEQSELSAETQRVQEQSFVLRSARVERVAKKSKAEKGKKPATLEETLVLARSGKTIPEIAEARDLVPSTICGHLEKLKQTKRMDGLELEKLLPKSIRPELKEILLAFGQSGGHLGPVFSQFQGAFSFDELRMARLLWEA